MAQSSAQRNNSFCKVTSSDLSLEHFLYPPLLSLSLSHYADQQQLGLQYLVTTGGQ